MLAHAPDIFGCVDREGIIIFVNEACKGITGYTSTELIGRNYLDFVHPDDHMHTIAAVEEAFETSRKVSFENRFAHRDGHIVTVHWSGIWSEDQHTLHCIGRDITAQKIQQTRLQQSEQYYRALFDNSPDIMFVEDRNGVITKVNQRFRAAFGVSDQQIIGSHVSRVLLPEMAFVNEISLKQTLLGKATRFDLELEQHGETRVFDVEKHPIVVDNEIVRVQTIAKDITPIVRSYTTIQQQAHELNTILESITDAFIALDSESRFTYVNSVFAKHEGYKKHEMIGRCIWEVFPRIVSSLFHRKCHEVAASGAPAHFEEYFPHTGLTYEFSIYPSEKGVSVYFIDVTEQRKTKQELEKLSLVASKSTNGVVIMNNERRIEWVNEGFTRLTGYTLEEAIGKRPIEFLAHEQTDLAALDSVREQLLDRKPVFYEVLNRTKCGEELWLSIENVPVQDENGETVQYVAIQSDITERVKTRKELQKLSLVASKTNNSVIIADKDWKIEWVNDGFTKLMGYTMQEAVGKRPSEFLHNHNTDRTAYEALEAELLSGKPISFEVINVTKDQEEVWVKVDITSTFDKNNKLEQFIEVHTDITALKEKELELSRLAQDLYRQNKDLQQFTYIVSHNLRAPVANILGLAGLLDKVGKASPLFSKSLNNLQESVLRLDNVVRDMNTILNIRDSKITLEREQVDVKLIMQQVLHSFQDQISECGGEFVDLLQEGLLVNANKAYLYSILQNLLSNAIKYRSEERVLQVRVRGCANAVHGVNVEFSDNGSGFDMEKAGDNVFKLYKRFHTDQKGNGIGLYLVKAHVDAMGGTVDVNSYVGVGTTFNVHFPNV
ncbi:PAS domain-containing sensor histidine kinase [Pontibacter sp. MBLB2868]|uniref:PAS domain-containing sensor histidine kinase n=1 Tax=Pontibacter sp. MBLB2868 TaxID=3451555 RepID=UPI003F753604